MESKSPQTPPEPGRNVIIPCGWGRLIFAHTFRDPREVAAALLEEQSGTRDIAFYVTDPHLVLNTAPQDLFMDPSDTYRIVFSQSTIRDESEPLTFSVGPLTSRQQIDEINRIYLALNMVPLDADAVWAQREDERMQFVVATSTRGGEVLAVALGIDHLLAFGDIENGSSLWSLAVDPQATTPGLGAGLVRYLVNFYRDRGRVQLDLSVMHDNVDAIQLYEKFGFQRVPVFAIKRCNSINENLFIGPTIPEGFNPYAMIIINEALRRGISVEPISPQDGYFRLTFGGRSIACRESLSDLTSAVTLSLCDDKKMTREILTAANFSLPDQTEAGTAAHNLAFLKMHGRVVVKPARGEQGHGVAVNLGTASEVEDAVRKARAFCDTVLLEKFVEGEDLRLVVINGEMVAAAVRCPPEVVGTGQHTIQQLIERASRRRSAATGGESQIPIDEETERCLREAGCSLETLLEPKRVVRVRNGANLHTGGTISDVTSRLHPDLADAAVRIAGELHIPVTGLDFIVPSVEGSEYWFIEANERPGLANHEPQPTAERFIDMLFPTSAMLRVEKPLNLTSSK